MEQIRQYSAEISLALVVLVLIQFGLVMSLNSRLAAVRRLIRDLLTGPGGTDLESLLRQCLAETEGVKTKAAEMEMQQALMSANLRHCVQHLGLIRFDAYSDVSGQQSFSLAMLDSNEDGAIITALFGRSDGRCYGKAVMKGQTEQALSQEETDALALARDKKNTGGGLRVENRAPETSRRRNNANRQ